VLDFQKEKVDFANWEIKTRVPLEFESRPMALRFALALRASCALITALLAITPAHGRGILYKATAGENTIYLFGTMHLTNPEHYPTDPLLMEAIEQAPVLYVENVDRPGVIRSVAAIFSLFQDPTYNALSTETRTRLSAQLKRANLSESFAFRTHPFVLTSMLNQMLCPEAKHTEVTVDEHLANFARNNKVRVEGFEDAKFSLDLFSKMSQEVRVSVVESALRETEKPGLCAENAVLTRSWMDSDIAQLEKLAKESLDDATPAGRYISQVLVLGRNTRMAELILARVPRQDGAVIAVGAMHLVGEGSILHILRSKGVAVERLY
jgi:uncharacterized protein YbaP (TraB family)